MRHGSFVSEPEGKISALIPKKLRHRLKLQLLRQHISIKQWMLHAVKKELGDK